MSDKIHELLNCNLQEVFGEATPRAVAPPSRSSTPRSVCSTCRSASSSDAEAVGPVRRRPARDHPHFAYRPRGEPQALHNAGRLAWGSGSGERPDYTGLDVIIVRGKIAALYVFLDSMPS